MSGYASEMDMTVVRVVSDWTGYRHRGYQYTRTDRPANRSSMGENW